MNRKGYEIKKKFLIPEAYIQKIPTCQKCGVELFFTGTQLLSAPLQNVMKCPNCKETYNISETEIQGEWKWREI